MIWLTTEIDTVSQMPDRMKLVRLEDESKKKFQRYW